ncbi:MAG: bifunctional riboflavin kinase/FAD synthetase [Parvularculaceae bacterium]
MKIVHAEQRLPEAFRGAVAALGNFDGVHRGHAMLIAEARRFAERRAAPLAAVVFDPHPREFFRPEDRPFLLTDLETKARLLGELGVEFVIVLDFDARLAGTDADSFVCDILADRLGLAGVVVGAEFRYGKARVGDARHLRETGDRTGMDVLIVEPAHAPGAEEKYSSTQARAALRDGDPAAARKILGRYWEIAATVEKGAARGRRIGFPTANLKLGRLVQPKPGVYAVIVKTPDGARHPGVANYGRRPTIGDLEEPLLEVHLIDFDGDLYGARLEVAFVDFIRPERTFDGLDALKAQIAADLETARRKLAAAAQPDSASRA